MPVQRTRLRRWIIAIVLVACALAVGTLLSARALMADSPAWWRAIDAGDPATIELATNVENAVVTEFHRARDPAAGVQEDEVWRSDPWEVVLGSRGASAWLTARFPRWLANREHVAWPEGAGQLQVEFDEGQVHIGARVEVRGRSRVLSATLRPVLTDGALWMRASTVRIGRLALPAAWLLEGERIERYLPDRVTLDGKLLGALRGQSPLLYGASIAIEGGRRVRIIDVAVHDGYLLLTCRTEQE